MTISTNFPFTTPGNYIYNSSLIEVVGGVAQLKLLDGNLQFTEDFTDDTGFTYDNVKSEFVAGALQQKSQIPLNAILGANYNSTINLTWRTDAGSLTGTVNGTSPTISSGKMVCSGTQGVYYSGTSKSTETLKIKYTPNYSGAPSADRDIFSMWDGTGNKDKMVLVHKVTTGDVFLRLYSNDGTPVQIFSGSVVSAWSPTSGTEYEIELCVQADGSTFRVTFYIDGVEQYDTTFGAQSRGGTIVRYYVGASPAYGFSDAADGSFNDFITYDNIQHTANYTAGYSLDFLYAATNVNLPQFVHGPLGFISSLLDFVITETSGSPRYSIQIQGGGYVYWNGSAWVSSDGTYAQANDLTTFDTNIVSLSIPMSSTNIDLRIHFTDTNTQGIVDNAALDYMGGAIYSTADPTIEPTTSLSVDALTNFVAVINEPANTNVNLILKIDGVKKYFNGTAWVNSDGSYSQSNDLTTIINNLSSWTDRGDLIPVIVLHSLDGVNKPHIDDLTVVYDFFGGSTTPENVCVVWGYLYDETNNPVSGIEIEVKPNVYGIINDKILHIKPKTIVTDSTGYFEIDLVETATALDTWGYIFRFKDPRFKDYTATKLVPNQATEQFTNLTDYT